MRIYVIGWMEKNKNKGRQKYNYVNQEKQNSRRRIRLHEALHCLLVSVDIYIYRFSGY